MVVRKSLGLLLLFLLAACAADEPLPESATAIPSVMAGEQASPFQRALDIQGHRGARGLKPENTLPAFETALDLGVDTLELDLHLSSDGVLVVWHDPEIDNDKCGLEPDASSESPDPDSLIVQGRKLMISQLTFDELQAYRCDRNPDPRRFPEQDNRPTALAGDRYGIISLAELFDFVEDYAGSDVKTDAQRENAGSVQFNVETKRNVDRPLNINDGFDGSTPGPFELAILDLVAARDLAARVVVQSFDRRSLNAIRTVNDHIRLAALTSGGQPDPPEYAASGANIWSPNYQDVSPDLLQEAHAAGLLVIPWTVNDPDRMKSLIELGVDGLISDRPDLLVNLS